MFPISDDDPRGRGLPIVTFLLIAVNALVFLYELTLSQPGLEQLFQTWGVVPARILNAFSHPGAPGSLQAFLTLITSQFLHMGWLHILGNMLFLYIFGDDIEALLGAPLYLVFYLVCGIVAGLVQTFVLSQFTGDVNTAGIGASGAIAGVLGAYLVCYPNRRITVASPTQAGIARSAVPAVVMLGLWFVQQLLSGVAAISGADASNVGFWAHIGGFVAGVLLVLPFRNRAVSTYSGGVRSPYQQ